MPRLDRRVLPALSDAEVRRLLSACKLERDRAIILFLLDTGCRAFEAVQVNGEDIDLQSGDVRIRQGKGRKERIVFLGQNARAQLIRYYHDRGTPESKDPVWISEKSSERLTTSGLHQILKRLGRYAHVEHCGPHTFRRTFALWSLRNGMDIFRLARLMGHADIAYSGPILI